MGRAPCCDKANVKKGPWSPEEDTKLKEYIEKHGTGGNWIALPQKAGLRRCGKSCRLRWLNYLRPNIKHGDFSDDEDRIICSLFASIGSRWSIIAAQLPGRTDNDIKNYWNTKLKKKLMGVGMAPSSQTRTQQSSAYSSVSFLEPSSLTSSPNSAPSLALSSARSGYTCNGTNYYTTPAKFVTGYETFSIPSKLLNTTCSASLGVPSVLQAQEGYMGSMHNYQVQDSFLRFGGEASSSSSDGSSTYDFGVSNGEHVNLQSYLYNGVDENQKFTFSSHVNGYADEKPNGSNYVENPLDCSLEEIKQLISTNLCNNFFVDEIKTEATVTYY